LAGQFCPVKQKKKNLFTGRPAGGFEEIFSVWDQPPRSFWDLQRRGPSRHRAPHFDAPPPCLRANPRRPNEFQTTATNVLWLARWIGTQSKKKRPMGPNSTHAPYFFFYRSCLWFFVRHQNPKRQKGVSPHCSRRGRGFTIQNPFSALNHPVICIVRTGWTHARNQGTASTPQAVDEQPQTKRRQSATRFSV